MRVLDNEASLPARRGARFWVADSPTSDPSPDRTPRSVRCPRTRPCCCSPTTPTCSTVPAASPSPWPATRTAAR